MSKPVTALPPESSEAAHSRNARRSPGTATGREGALGRCGVLMGGEGGEGGPTPAEFEAATEKAYIAPSLKPEIDASVPVTTMAAVGVRGEITTS